MYYRKKVTLVIGTRARRHVTHVTRKRATVLISNHALSRPDDGLLVFTYLNIVTDCRRNGRSGDGGRPANGAPRFCCQQSTCCFRTVESTAFIFIYLHSYYFDADRFAERLAPFSFCHISVSSRPAPISSPFRPNFSPRYTPNN